MSDLISRKAVTTEIHNYFKGLVDKGIHDVDVVDCNAEISKRIDGIQAAYDVDKVVEQLEKLPHRRLQLGDAMMDIMESKKNDRHFVCLEDVIGIVKGAVKDE